ncbi:45807_t:CDS:1, partial [Gigaspora margarita]
SRDEATVTDTDIWKRINKEIKCGTIKEMPHFVHKVFCGRTSLRKTPFLVLQLQIKT